MKKTMFVLLLLLLFIIGCSSEIHDNYKEISSNQDFPEDMKPWMTGPGGCKSRQECMAYCSDNPEDLRCIEDEKKFAKTREESYDRNEFKEPTEIIAAPNVQGDIYGYWSSRAGMIINELENSEHMHEVGINTITFSPALSHDEQGNVLEQSGTEAMIKTAINKAHLAGFRVMLETTPMNAGEVGTKVRNPKIFQQDMSELAIKYAIIAEEYNVEYFAPIVEPVHHMSVKEADEWMQELLPKLKKVYSGPIMWKKQSMHLQDPKEFSENHTLLLGFKTNTGFNMKLKYSMDHSIKLELNSNRISLEEWQVNEKKIDINKLINLDTDYHLLKIEIIGKQIKIFLDDKKVIEHSDDSGPLGGYQLYSDSLAINQFEIRNTNGDVLFKERFENLNNWNAQKGWIIKNNEIIISSHEESTLIHDIDFSGYDYIAIDTFRRGKAETSEHYLEFLEFVIDKTNDQAEADNVPNVIIAEFGGSIMEDVGWQDVDERSKIPITEEELAMVTRKVMEIGKVDGYIYNGWDIEGQGINKMPLIKEVIKEEYSKVKE